ncbi:aspartate carbamoyltransferase [Lagierella massiliensis]|uniref:aspartate carbamoyltransferase n=1 Tax=Lagierella massiliensis TaxID=1689303 RepID=UPI0006D76551|nr:aspartate carbamoyltransferase [Lagierella massiliensis]
MLSGRDLIEINDFSKEDISEIMDLAQDIIKSPESFSSCCTGKILGTLFFEPSTRTRLSFESAIHRLGGDCIGFSESASSSTAKGESLADTVKTISNYVDIIAMRHPKEGSATLSKDFTTVPLINAGDGGHQHPTQTLTDLLTIMQTKGTFENLTIGLCGDLKFGRTVHSLVKAMSMYPNNKFVFISPEELKIPEYIKINLRSKNIEFVETEKLSSVMGELDILYMTRVQRERFFNEEDYIRLKDSYILTLEKLEDAKKDLAILHPLPRVNEIAVEVDSDPRAVYFKQVKYGVIVRMALILKLLGVK